MAIYRRILMATDGSPGTAVTLTHAEALAADQGAQLKLVTVVDEAIGSYMGGELAWIDPATLRSNLLEGARQVLERAAAHARAAGLTVESELIEAPEGHVGRAIITAANAWPADLLVVSTHGRHGLTRLVLGSMAETLVRWGNLPILVVPAGEAGTDKAAP